MKTLEAYLIDAQHFGCTAHTVTAERGPTGEIRATFRMAGDVGDGITFEVRGDTVSQPFMTFDAGEMLAVEGPALATSEDIEALRQSVLDIARAFAGAGAAAAAVSEKAGEVREQIADIRESIRRGARPTGSRFKL